MSSEEIFRKGQIGTEITLIIHEPDPNNPGETIVVDITNKDAVGIEFKRPNKTKFIYVDKAGDPDLVPSPSTITVIGAPTSGTIRFKDNIGVFNVKGPWAYRGIYKEDNGTVIEEYPGSWIERMVGE